MRVLMHICCAPCSIYVLKRLREEGALVEGYFYNPNIHPYTEYLKRLATVENYAGISLLPITIDKEYDLEGFLKGALACGKDRCLFCYRTRLDRTFQRGALAGAEYVTTTLLYSKHQRHEEIKAIGQELSEKYAIPFLYEDFRKGWKEGIEASKAIGMYRQPYCGCIMSEHERFGGA
jgi:predicted adenine nucleotide alpha hydrolase (AANH) superfamily ATPase